MQRPTSMSLLEESSTRWRGFSLWANRLTDADLGHERPPSPRLSAPASISSSHAREAARNGGAGVGLSATEAGYCSPSARLPYVATMAGRMEEVFAMKAKVGDWVVVKGFTIDQPEQHGLITEVHSDD